MKCLIFAFLLWGINCHPQKLIESTDGKQEDRDLIKATVFGFLQWYKRNHSEIESFVLVPASRDNDPTNLYQVEPESAKSFLKKLESSGYLTPSFIAELGDYIKKCDQKMRAKRQTDGPPEGLDSDLILATHEVDDSMDRISGSMELSIIKIDGSAASAKVTLVYDLTFHLKKESGKWLISK